jgi:NAD(P)-dependent dehydrogenase (short-subunit alcohol dehydrogenase family)
MDTPRKLDQVAYITGGTKGIGYGIAQALLEEGYRVAISGRDAVQAIEAARQLGPEDRVLGLGSDVRFLDQEETASKTILEAWGRIDVVMANAGLGSFAPVDQMTLAQWNAMIDTNLSGPFHTLKATVEALKESEGYFMTLASLAGTNFFPNGAGYNASKFGLVGFSQAAMLDLRPYNIKVTTIMPGSVASHFNDHEPGDADAWKIQPEDLGQIVVDLLRMHPRTLPSKVEVRPTRPDLKG